MSQEGQLNLILLFPEDFVGSEYHIRLRGRRLKHVLGVHRATVGDELCVGKIDGNIGYGKIVQLSESALDMEVLLNKQPPAPLPLTLLLALPRPKVLRRVLRSVSALGVKRVVLFNCFRVEKSYWQSPLLKSDLIQEQLVLGLEQARDTVLPKILFRPLFKPFVEDELPGIVKETLPLVAHPAASTSCPRDVKKRAVLAVGPEGGFIPYELDKLVQCGFMPVRMGERVLSVETAVPALISRLF
jgi:16S rRNA (uracil1498-N3)-methyltransferase